MLGAISEPEGDCWQLTKLFAEKHAKHAKLVLSFNIRDKSKQLVELFLARGGAKFKVTLL